MIPNNITKDHILAALEEIDKNGIPKDRISSAYNLVAAGKSYPPKYVISLANKHANGRELSPQDFQGGAGTDTHKILQGFGFEIIQKNDPRADLIEQYKKRISQNQLEDEVYKWQLIAQFKGRPNLEAADFNQEIRELQFGNLIYAMAFAVLRHLAKAKPEELRVLFRELFDESKALSVRIQRYTDESHKLYRSLGETKPHHQDERSIACYLTFFNPEKYALYKSSFYSKYCQLLRIKEAKKNEKYVHYLELITELVEDYIEPDDELKALVQNAIPEFYDETNLKLIAQDMLYQMLEQEAETNYWIFQGNPKIFDFETALRENLLNDWTVTAYKEKIKIGDKVILWITGSKAGCYALAEVTCEPFEKQNSPDSHLWKTEDKSELKANIKILHNLVDFPIAKSQIESIDALKGLKVGSQGTNFSATAEEFNAFLELIQNKMIKKYWLYAPGENASKWDEFYEQGIMGLGWDELGDLSNYANKEEIVKRLQELESTTSSKKNDASANDDFKNGISIGDVIIAKKGRKEYLGYGIVTSDYYYNVSRDSFQKLRKVDWMKKGVWTETAHPTVIKTLTDITSYTDYVDRLKKLIGINHEAPKNNTMIEPINQILYGPPGTGKTYELKIQYFPKYTTKENALSLEQYIDSLVRDLTWWQVITLALIEEGTSRVNDLFNNRWVAKKASFSESKNVRATLWGTLQMHTIQSSQTVSYTQRQAPLVFDKLEDKTWQLIESEARENCPDLYELIDKVNNFNPDPDKEIKRYVFTTFHQSFGYEDFIEGIKPVISDDETNIELTYTIEDGIFKQICSRASSDPANRYAIFIDEINRGNVSAVFGELITLIEKDKRIGMENELKVKLPYSKKDFGVPANLDIYGTMNTADRSVEALDTALRRRFSFTEMPPLYDLPELAYEYAGFQGKDILRTINQRIEKLLDRDHLIGHSYFLKKAEQDTEEKLMDSFYRNIIPLIQEYFYGDYAKIGAVLGAGFVYKNDDKAAVVFAAGFGDEDYSDKAIYQIIDYRPEQSGNQYVQTGMTFEEAIKLLMPKQSQKEVNA